MKSRPKVNAWTVKANVTLVEHYQNGFIKTALSKHYQNVPPRVEFFWHITKILHEFLVDFRT